MTDVPSIPEFFRDKRIFVTGGSGFIGKAVIEILLRLCDIKVIYLLLRPKKGVAVQDRLNGILDNPLYDIVRKTKPEALEKVVAVSGDVTCLKLGLNQEDRELVLSSNIVFHVAASVRFDDPLKKAVIMNTRGTREMMELMMQMKNLIVGVHVSTTYCNVDKEVIEERVYRDHGDWKQAIHIAERYEDDYRINCLTEKCLGGLRNTYVYSKHLAENIVEDYSHQLPLVLFRPGVVISTWKDPIPGWHDNFYGPIGFGIAVGKGIMRTTYTGTTLLQDYMPLDIVIKALIIATWQKTTNPSLPKLPVYNCSVLGKLSQTHSQWSETGLKIIKQEPYSDILWYPAMNTCTNEFTFRIHFFFKHVIPGILLDLALRLSGRKPMFVKLFKKLFIGMMTIAYFLTRAWDFKSENMWSLSEKLNPEDREKFAYSFEGFSIENFMRQALTGSKLYLLKEPINFEKDMQRYKRLAVVYHILLYGSYTLILYYTLTSSIFNGAIQNITSVTTRSNVIN